MHSMTVQTILEVNEYLKSIAKKPTVDMHEGIPCKTPYCGRQALFYEYRDVGAHGACEYLLFKCLSSHITWVTGKEMPKSNERRT